jgi:murein DD-endopeptidase MepM/ murein hydrolase activator NlpD
MLQNPESNHQKIPGTALEITQKYLFDPRIPLVTVFLVSLMMVIILGQVEGESGEIKTAPVNESVFISPYKKYTVTQGLHGFSYGHMAIDLSAGKGSKIRSPINGVVTAKYVDSLGNTTLVIENKKYQVTLLHGKYNVSIDDVLTVGQVVGTESNKGNTTDMQGRSCRNRDCGYHTHLNVYNKLKDTNVNPLSLLGK